MPLLYTAGIAFANTIDVDIDIIANTIHVDVDIVIATHIVIAAAIAIAAAAAVGETFWDRIAF